MTPGEVAALLVGIVIGVALSFVATWLALGFVEWRRGLREGTPIVGEALERAKKRGDL